MVFYQDIFSFRIKKVYYLREDAFFEMKLFLRDGINY